MQEDENWTNTPFSISPILFYWMQVLNLIQPLQIEPFFVMFAVYDANNGLKISENFNVDWNFAFLKQMVPPSEGCIDDGPNPVCMKAARATEVNEDE